MVFARCRYAVPPDIVNVDMYPPEIFVEFSSHSGEVTTNKLEQRGAVYVPPSPPIKCLSIIQQSRVLCCDAGSSHGGSFLDNLTDPRASAREYEVVFGLSGSSSGRPDLGLTMQADYYGNQAIVKGFSLVDGRVSEVLELGNLALAVGGLALC